MEGGLNNVRFWHTADVQNGVMTENVSRISQRLPVRVLNVVPHDLHSPVILSKPIANKNSYRYTYKQAIQLLLGCMLCPLLN